MEMRKTQPLVIALRVILALTFMLKSVYTVHTQAAAMLEGISVAFGWAVAFAAVLYGLISFALFWAVSSLAYNNISISRYFPATDAGQCALPREKFLLAAYTAAIINNVVSGALNAMLYAVPVAMPFVTLVASKIISIIAVLALNAYLSAKYAKGNLKEYVTAMALPSFFLIVVMGV